MSPAQKKLFCSDKNPFPNLIMKEVPKKEVKPRQNNYVVAKTSEREMETDPGTFKLSKQSYIYDSVNGNILETWKIKTTFTSNIATQNWVKITGFFGGGKWIQAKKDLWVKKANVVKR